jgi:hypothetical protein
MIEYCISGKDSWANSSPVAGLTAWYVRNSLSSAEAPVITVGVSQVFHLLITDLFSLQAERAIFLVHKLRY